MSNQDYITRTPAKKKKNNPYKKKSAEQKPPRNIKGTLITVLIIVLLCAFAFSLWLLKTSDSTKTPIKTTTQVEETKPEKALPKPPKAKWRYVDDLKNKEVEIATYNVEQGGPYKMQCGSFKKRTQAESLKAKMAFVGVESQIQTAQGKTGTWYKVVLGPYKQKRVAEKDKHKLKSNKIYHCQIWLWK